jgi:hypothetical protein
MCRQTYPCHEQQQQHDPRKIGTWVRLLGPCQGAWHQWAARWYEARTKGRGHLDRAQELSRT